MTYACEIHLNPSGGVVQFDGYLEFARKLEALDGPCEVLVDLSTSRFFHPTGMAPIVAVIRALTDEGWAFDVDLPPKPALRDYFVKAGWVAGITNVEPEPVKTMRGTTYVPLTRYESATELNPLLNEILDHFVRQSVFGVGVLEAIEWTVNEVADNVLNHAGGVPGWVQLAEQPKKGLIEIVVVDCGQGIANSLRERYSDLEDDAEAVRLAAEKGVTRNPDVGQGNGLAGTLRIAITSHGWANIASGRGLLRYRPPGGHARPGRTTAPRGAEQSISVGAGPLHRGTVVSLTLPTKGRLDVAGALWGSRPSTTIENDYLTDGGDFAKFSLLSEASGFGNRASARPLRQKLHNIMNLVPNGRVIVDFDGVNVISASFADEFIARLAKEVGVASFFQQVMLRNMNDLVKRTLDAVMEQRLSQ